MKMRLFPYSGRRTVLTLALIVVSVAALFATVPKRMNFQGKLLDKNNNPRNGSFNMTFSIWDDGPGTGVGSMLWSGTQTVPVTNGVFSVQLGKGNPLPPSVFSGATTYLQVQVEAEVAAARQRLVASPYSFRAALSDDLEPGDEDYIQNTDVLQPNSTFYVLKGSVDGPLDVGSNLTVGGILTTGSSGHQVTTAAGLLEAGKLTGTVPSAQLSGTYPNAVAGGVLAGSTHYIQVRDTLQAGATLFVSKASVAGPFIATGAVTLGGTGANVTVAGDLTVSGAGPHVFTGDIRVNGNDLLDSGGTSRISLGSTLVLNGTLMSGSSSEGVLVSTNIYIAAGANGDNFIAVPFVAGGTINKRNAVIISGANTITTTSSADDNRVIGISVNSGTSGQTIYVAMYGVVTNVVANGAVPVAALVCTANSTGRLDDQNCRIDGGTIGKALTGASSAGDTFTIVLWQGL